MSQGKAIRRYKSEDDTKPTVWILKDKVCPFAEKAVVALYEMGIDFDVIEVDIENKPASLFEVNKKGLVPAMKDQGNAVADSYIILEYINDMWTKSDGKSFFPESPVQRAVARTWCAFINNNLAKNWYEVAFKQEQHEVEEAKHKIIDNIKVLDEAMRSISEGPFFMGKEFGVVDIMLAPHVERFPVLERLSGFKVPETEELQRFKAWWKAVEGVSNFQKARVDVNLYYNLLKKGIEKRLKAKAN